MSDEQLFCRIMLQLSALRTNLNGNSTCFDVVLADFGDSAGTQPRVAEETEELRVLVHDTSTFNDLADRAARQRNAVGCSAAQFAGR